jgi:hypothetical protein
MLIKSTGKLITTAHAPKHECAFIALIVYTVLKGSSRRNYFIQNRFFFTPKGTRKFFMAFF